MCPHYAEGVAQPAGGLVGETTEGAHAAQGGSEVGHLVALRVTAGGRGSVASKEDSCWDAIQVGVLWGVSGPGGRRDRPVETLKIGGLTVAQEASG